MKNTVKILTIVGICLYGLGTLLNLWSSFWEIFISVGFSMGSSNTEYTVKTVLIIVAAVLVNLIIAVLIGFLAYKFLKMKERKGAIRFCIASGILMLFTGLLTVFNFTLAIPQYLIYSEVGLIETYITYFMPLLENGVILRFIAPVLMFIAAMMFILQKRKINDEVQ